MIPFPNKKYSVIYADPPWSYQDKRCNGNAADHYPTMRIDDICSLPVQDIADDNCVLFLWATYPMLKEALRVIEAWGFKYKSICLRGITSSTRTARNTRCGETALRCLVRCMSCRAFKLF